MFERQCPRCQTVHLVVAPADPATSETSDHPCIACGSALDRARVDRHADAPAPTADLAADRVAAVVPVVDGINVRLPAERSFRRAFPPLAFAAVFSAAIVFIAVERGRAGQLWPDGLVLLPFAIAAVILAWSAFGDALRDRIVEVRSDVLRIRRAGPRRARVAARTDILAIGPPAAGQPGLDLHHTAGTFRISRTIREPDRARVVRTLVEAIRA